MTTVEARAKLTLSLRVDGVRDDGFHLIDAEMVELELSDLLELQEPAGGGAGELVVDGPFAAGIGDGPDNLVRRALALAGRRANVRLTKRIPHGGGLGGGSADAQTAGNTARSASRIRSMPVTIPDSRSEPRRPAVPPNP